LFSKAVSRIPQDVRPLVSLRQVSLRRAGRLEGLAGLTRWTERTGRRGSPGGSGRQTITYYSSLLDCLSDEAYVAIIVHELAHAWLNEHVAPAQSSDREREADELVAGWGFEKELAQLDNEAYTIGDSAY
jgi:hypothetical protein